MKAVIVAFPQFSGSYNGSMGHYFHHICSALERRGIKVYRAVPGEYGTTLRSIGAGGPITDAGLRWARSLGRWMGEYAWFQICFRFARNPVPFVVIAQEYAPFLCARSSVVIAHDMIQSDYPRSRFVGWYYRVVVKGALLKAKGVISDTQATQTVLHRLGIASDVVYPWIEVSKYRSLRSQRQVTQEAAFLWIGTAATHKDLRTLLAAALELPAVSFHVVLPKRDLAKFGGLGPNVRLLSELSPEEMLALYQKATGFISTSLVEGYGMPAMEARLAGIPLILADIPVYRELHDGHAAFYAPQNVAGLVASIKALLAGGAGQLAPELPDEKIATLAISAPDDLASSIMAKTG